jgi:hypothetical protein
MFHVPAGDFDDVDEDNTTQRQEQRPVPGPKQAKQETTSHEAAPAEPLKDPHKIVLGQGAGADQWAGAYIKAIEKAKSETEIKEWDNLNNEILQAVSDRYSKIYDMIDAAVQRRLQDLGAKVDPKELGMPDPKVDAQESMNWIAGELQKFNTLTDAVAFWSNVVGPRESEFDPEDRGMLEQEWVRTRERLTGAPPQDAA